MSTSIPNSTPTIEPNNTTTGEPSSNIAPSSAATATPISKPVIAASIPPTVAFSSIATSMKVNSATFTAPQTNISEPTNPKHLFGIDLDCSTRKNLINTTNLSNNVSVVSSFLGYCFSAGQGIGRLWNPTIPIAWNLNSPMSTPAKFMTAGRLSYNFGSFSLSAGRGLTTFPENREEPSAKFWAETSRVLSGISVVHGVGVMLGHIFGPKWFRMYAMNSGFNGTSLAGTTAASSSTISEIIENKAILDKNAKELARQENIPEEVSLKIIKSSLPHKTWDETTGYLVGYGLSTIAAIGGLADGLPLVEKHYPEQYKKLAKTFGENSLKFAAKWGGPANGIGYAFAFALYAAIVYNGYDSEERRVSKRFDQQFKPVHERGLFDTAVTFGLMGIGILALRSGKTASAADFAEFFSKPNTTIFEKIKIRLPFFGIMMLNKLDVAAVGGLGATAIINHPWDTPWKSLLSVSGNSRRTWAGPRMSTGKDTHEYLVNTDPTLPKEEQDRFINKITDHNISHKLSDNVSTMSPDQKRDLLENGRYKKVTTSTDNGRNVTTNVKYIPTDKEDPDRRPYHMGAKYAAEAREKARKWKAENPNWTPETGISKFIKNKLQNDKLLNEIFGTANEPNMSFYR